ncbi:MAG: PilC/PilY family type IV pilus protein, partial [Myxococcota bacterium]|nr:PilC/PilY family type IV pilus protein [Myxococcota bacterium]
IYTEKLLNGTHQYAPKCRPTVLYAGTHDGMIHAFRADRFNSDSGACAGTVPTQGEDDVGQELWSLMPQHLLKRSHLLVGAYQFLMDGQMRLSDVLLVRGNPTESSVTTESSNWRSVLTAGYGAGGRGFIAIDVTNALDGPDVLWEIDHEQRCKGGTCYPADGGAFGDDFSKLGLTKARPAYGTAFLDNREVSIAVLPAGDDPDDKARPESGRAVYIVRLDTGEKVAEFSNDTGNVNNLSGGSVELDYHFTGSPSVYSNVPGVVSTRAFVGDAGGRLWRIDMRPTDPGDWKMELFFDTYEDGPLTAVVNETENHRQPLFGAPALALNSADGHLAVIFGNGSIDQIRTASKSEVGVFSVSETSSTSGSVSSEMNWAHVLAGNERLTGEAIVFNSTSYFTTYMADELDACATGSGRIYGLHFTSSNGNDPVGTLDADADPTTLGTVAYAETGDAVPFGVQIIERPSCQPESGSSTDLGGTANGANGVARGDLQLVVNVAKGPGFDASSVPPGANGESMATKNLTRNVGDSGEMIQGGTWGYVLF